MALGGELFFCYSEAFGLWQNLQSFKITFLNCWFEIFFQKEALAKFGDNVFVSFFGFYAPFHVFTFSKAYTAVYYVNSGL